MPNSKTYNEKELLFDVANGNEAAFTSLFTKYSKLLYSFLYRHTDDTQLADDLVQDIFTKIWLTRETLAEVENFGSYLFVLARNHALNILKKRVQDRKRDIQWHQLIDQTNDNRQQEQFLDLIEQAIEQLPEQQRKTWIMSRRNKMTYVEIAESLGISRETVKTYLRYANAGISKYVLANSNLGILLLVIKIL